VGVPGGIVYLRAGSRRYDADGLDAHEYRLVALSNAPQTYAEAEKFAEKIADGYRLVESSQRRALRMADAPEEDEE
jgi:hypothetical protein